MDNDLKKGLLGKKSSGFDKVYEECQIRIQRVKQKNDVMQKQIGTEIQQSIRTEVNNQKKFLQKEVNELKALMTKIELDYRDPQSKTKIKQLKTEAQRQIQRNRIILKDLINKSFNARSMNRNNQDQNSQKLIQGGKANLSYYDKDREEQQDDRHKQSILTDQQIEVDEIDYQFQRKILLQKNEMLNEVEQSTLRINEIINDEAVMIQQQGEHLDIITDQLQKTTNNLEDTNQNLEQASSLQKKSKKKYIFFVILIFLILIVVGGVIYIVTQ